MSHLIAQPRRAGLLDGLFKVQWSLTYAGFLVYVFVVVTFKGGIASIAMALAVFGLLQRLGSIRFPAPMIWLTIYFAWSVIGSLGSEYRDVAFTALVLRGKVFIIALAAFNALRSRGQIRLFMVFFLACYTLVPARAALLNFFRGHRLFGRAIGSFIYENPNYLAALTILAVAIGLAVLAGERRKSLVWWCAMLATPLLLFLILLTQSRGAILAIGLVSLPFFLGLARRRPKAILGIGAVAAVALLATPDAVWQRISGMRKLASAETVAEADAEGSARERFALLQNGLRISADHPVFGTGLGTFPLANRDYDPVVGARDAHNTYITTLVETGLPGLVMLFVVLGTTLAHAYRSYRASHLLLPRQSEQVRVVTLGMVAFLIAGTFGTYSTLNFFYLYVALVWCIADCTWREARALGQAPQPARQAAEATPARVIV